MMVHVLSACARVRQVAGDRRGKVFSAGEVGAVLLRQVRFSASAARLLATGRLGPSIRRLGLLDALQLGVHALLRLPQPYGALALDALQVRSQGCPDFLEAHVVGVRHCVHVVDSPTTCGVGFVGFASVGECSPAEREKGLDPW